MRKFNILIAAALLLSLVSCDKFFEGVNDNPNDPTEVTPDVLLAAAEGYIAYGCGGDVSRFTSVVTQQATGITRQWTTYDRYTITETEFDNWWRFNHYGGGLNDLYLLNQMAEENGYTQYAGVSKVLMAYGVMVSTDLFGDVPYSEAFLGTDNLTPAYDNQADIYVAIIALLNEAKTELAEAPAPISPGADDLIYGGDAAMWTMTANVLLARAYLHQGAVSNANYAAALTALGTEGVDTYGSSADDCEFPFGTSPTENNPWFQFNDQRGDIDHSGFMYQWMVAEDDPRQNIFVDTTGGAFLMGAAIGGPASPFSLASYVEVKFIEAEAAFQTGDMARAATAHNAAVMASLAQWGVSGSSATFETNHASETAASITLEKIMNNKYVALFTSPESFNDWRRTGFPAISPVSGNTTGGIIPLRFPYPQSERLYNPNMPTGQTLLDAVWWDQ